MTSSCQSWTRMGTSLHYSSKTGRHYRIEVRRWLDQQFPGHWIDQRGPVEWPPRSPDLTPMDFYLWGHLKSIMYQKKIRNMDHLKRRITAACKQITGATMKHRRQNWLERLSFCLDMKGRHVENKARKVCDNGV